MIDMPHGTFRATRPLVLASSSPRRKDLLNELGIDFTIVTANGAEPTPEINEDPSIYVMRAAKAKAMAVAEKLDQTEPGNDSVILGSDTIVVLYDETGPVILGKPESPAQALAMLLHLSGKSHVVHTGCCLLWPGVPDRRIECFHDAATVTFAPWPEPVLQAYVATGEGMDKAGAYAIQGKGSFLVSQIHGLWSTIVGLPILPVAEHLLRGGAICPQAETESPLFKK